MRKKDYIIDIPEFLSIFSDYFWWKKWKKSWENFMISCPFHKDNNPSFWISERVELEDWRFQCKWNCYSCHRSWRSLDSLLLKLWREVDWDESSNITKKHKLIKSAFWYEWVFSVLESLDEKEEMKKEITFIDDSDFFQKYYTIEPHQYFLDRWFNEDTWNFWNFWFSENLKRILFPLKNHSWKTVSYIWRAIEKDMNPKYLYYWAWLSKQTWIVKKTDFLFWLDKIELDEDTCILCEWPLNTIKIFQCWKENSVAIMWSKISQKQMKLLSERFNNYILWFDNDSAWQDWRKDFIKKVLELDNRYIKTVKCIISDSDACDLTEEEVLKRIDNAIEIDLDEEERKTRKKFKKKFNWVIIEDL